MEVFLQLLVELLLEALFQIVGAIIGQTIAPLGGGVFMLKVVLYSLLGAVIGYGSFLVYPEPLIGGGPDPLVNLLLGPLIVASLFTVLARQWERRTRHEVEMCRFAHSMAFAWFFEALRYVCLVGIVPYGSPA